MKKGRTSLFALKEIMLTLFFIAYNGCLSLLAPAYATSYYIDATYGNDANNGTSAATPWKTISIANRSHFSPGDNILLKRGEIWRESLMVSSSGNSENPIIFGAYGNGNRPIIAGADELQGTAEDWTRADANVWYRAVPIEGKVVLFNSEHLGIQVSPPASPYNFVWANKRLYVYAESNPAIYYKSIQVGQRGSVITSNNQHDIIIKDVSIYGGQLDKDEIGPGGCLYIPVHSYNIAIKNNTISKCHGGGVRILGARSVTIDSNEITDIDSHRTTLTGDAITVSWHYDTKTTPKQVSILNNSIGGFVDRMGIAVLDCDGLIISRNTVTAGVAGIDIEPNTGTRQGVRNATIDHNVVKKDLYPRRPMNIGISISGENSSNITISDNVVDGNDTNPSFGLMIYERIKTVLASRNTITNSRIGIQVGSNARDITLRENNIMTNGVSHLYGIYVKDGSSALLDNNTIKGAYENSVLIDGIGTSVEGFSNCFQNYAHYGLEVLNVPSSIVFKRNVFSSPSAVYHFVKPSNATAILDENTYSPPGDYYRWDGRTFTFQDYRATSGQDSKGKESARGTPCPPRSLKVIDSFTP